MNSTRRGLLVVFVVLTVLFIFGIAQAQTSLNAMLILIRYHTIN